MLFLNPILILWTQEVIEADKLSITDAPFQVKVKMFSIQGILSPQNQNGIRKQRWIPKKLPLLYINLSKFND